MVGHRHNTLLRKEHLRLRILRLSLWILRLRISQTFWKHTLWVENMLQEFGRMQTKARIAMSTIMGLWKFRTLVKEVITLPRVSRTVVKEVDAVRTFYRVDAGRHHPLKYTYNLGNVMYNSGVPLASHLTQARRELWGRRSQMG
jgi:hypothetical protein